MLQKINDLKFEVHLEVHVTLNRNKTEKISCTYMYNTKILFSTIQQYTFKTHF